MCNISTIAFNRTLRNPNAYSKRKAMLTSKCVHSDPLVSNLQRLEDDLLKWSSMSNLPSDVWEVWHLHYFGSMRSGLSITDRCLPTSVDRYRCMKSEKCYSRHLWWFRVTARVLEIFGHKIVIPENKLDVIKYLLGLLFLRLEDRWFLFNNAALVSFGQSATT